MRHFFTTLFFLSLALSSQGQVFYNVEAIGECEKSKNVNAERVALVRAKENARSQVCGEAISSATVYRVHDGKIELHKQTKIEESGLVFVKDKEVINAKDRVIVKIHADVVDSKKPKMFDVELVYQKTGGNDYLLKNRQYTENDKLEFKIKSHSTNCINVFWFDEDTYEGGLLFSCFMTEGQERVYGEFSFWKKIFPELLTPDERYDIAMRYRTYIYPKERTGGKKHIKFVFISTPDKLAPADAIKDELGFEDWWCEVPYNQRQQPAIEHITFLM